jgi:hypothetical protein
MFRAVGSHRVSGAVAKVGWSNGSGVHLQQGEAKG